MADQPNKETIEDEIAKITLDEDLAVDREPLPLEDPVVEEKNEPLPSLIAEHRDPNGVEMTEENKDTFVVVPDKKSIIFNDNLGILADSFNNSIKQEYNPNFDMARKICTISQEETPFGSMTRLKWSDDTFPPNDRTLIDYESNLDSVAEYKEDETVAAHISIIFATLECVRKGLGATEVFFAGDDETDEDSNIVFMF